MIIPPSSGNDANQKNSNNLLGIGGRYHIWINEKQMGRLNNQLTNIESMPTDISEQQRVHQNTPANHLKPDRRSIPEPHGTASFQRKRAIPFGMTLVFVELGGIALIIQYANISNTYNDINMMTTH